MKIHCVQWPRVYIDCTALRVCAQKVAPDARRLHYSPCVCVQKDAPDAPCGVTPAMGKRRAASPLPSSSPTLVLYMMTLRDLTSEVE